MRVLIIDDDETTLQTLQIRLEAELPGARITTYNSERLGRPGPRFDWTAHDVLLLDYNLGHGETGTEWLEAFASQPEFPKTILLTAERSPRIVGDAVRSGAVGYLNKCELGPGVLADTVKGVMTPAPAAPAPKTETDETWEDQSGAKYRGRDALETGGASYRFIRLIGRGAMSRVYLSERNEDRATLVLKILDRDVARDPENVQRFAREGELISRIHSPYVVRIFDHGMTNSYGYIAMEFFGRGDLAQRMNQGVSPEDAVLYLHNIACGLEAIHREGIVHRDLKPGNIMFRGDGSMALVDFGLSKPLESDLSLTQTGVILGTPYCMSPEQTEGEGADQRSDLYAAGVLFYEMLTGQRPFTGESLTALLVAIQREPVPTLAGDLARFQPVVDKLLAKDPAHRFQSAGALIEAVAELAVAA